MNYLFILENFNIYGLNGFLLRKLITMTGSQRLWLIGVANGFPKENELAYSLSIAKTSRAVAAFNIVPVYDEREDRPLSLCVSPLEMRVI